MSSVIAMIYQNEICLASDKKSINHETGLEETVIKQIAINDRIAVGFAGAGNIAELIMSTLSNPENREKVSSFSVNKMGEVLDDIFQWYDNKYHPIDEKGIVHALIVGYDIGCSPEIILWKSRGGSESITQEELGSFVFRTIAPYDMNKQSCDNILRKIAINHNGPVFLRDIATDYFKTISTISEYVSESAEIWIQFVVR